MTTQTSRRAIGRDWGHPLTDVEVNFEGLFQPILGGCFAHTEALAVDQANAYQPSAIIALPTHALDIDQANAYQPSGTIALPTQAITITNV